MNYTQNFRVPAWCLAIIVAFLFLTVRPAPAQTASFPPDVSVTGIRLGDRNSAKSFLAGYSPTAGEDGGPNYYFYNSEGTQVMRLVPASFEDRYLITAIEVFAVSESYRKAHFQAEDIQFFVTDGGIFIGYRPSLKTQLLGVPGLSRSDMIGPKDLIKRKGPPAERSDISEEREALSYRISNFELRDETGQPTTYTYTARYEFRKNKLKRISLAITRQAIASGSSR